MLKFTQIHKTYNDNGQPHTALQEVSAEINAGESVALCGPSGSGKSTLLNICGLLDSDYQGALSLDGQVVPKCADSLTQIRRAHIGFIFQRYNLVPVMTVLENIELPLMMLNMPSAQRLELAAKMAVQVGLKDHINKRPDQLSGGQQQRVAIARALVKRPKLVIADEPTANLDTTTANLVMDMMAALGQQYGTTFLMATHDDRMLHRFARRFNLQDGELQQVTTTNSFWRAG